MPTTNEESYTLYNGAVSLTFKPNSTKYRYTVVDASEGNQGFTVRGVTSVLRDIIAKPDLMTWPLSMSNKHLFGSKFDETLKDYTHDWSNALLKPDTKYTEDELHNLMLDGSRQWTKRSDQGKDVGTMTHEAIEAFLKGVDYAYTLPDDVDAELFKENMKMSQKAVQSFIDWWNSLEEAEVLSTERVVYSRGMKYAGTFDLLAKINGKTYLLDVKTTNASKKAPLGIYAEYFLQLGAYSYAYREELGEDVDDVGIVRVGKDGKLCIATATDIGLDREACEKAFAFAARLHDWLNVATPYLADVHFKSHLIQSGRVDEPDSESN